MRQTITSACIKHAQSTVKFFEVRCYQDKYLYNIVILSSVQLFNVIIKISSPLNSLVISIWKWNVNFLNRFNYKIIISCKGNCGQSEYICIQIVSTYWVSSAQCIPNSHYIVTEWCYVIIIMKIDSPYLAPQELLIINTTELDFNHK